MLASASQVYVFFPGGYGTLDELFEMLTLVQTKKVQPITIILVNKDFWRPLLSWINETMYRDGKAISKSDLNLFHLVDGADEALELIRKMAKRKKLKHRSRVNSLLSPQNKSGIRMPRKTTQAPPVAAVKIINRTRR